MGPCRGMGAAMRGSPAVVVCRDGHANSQGVARLAQEQRRSCGDPGRRDRGLSSCRAADGALDKLGKPATPFRVPPGIKLIRVDLATGTRAGAGGGTIMEAFKPGTAPPDSDPTPLPSLPEDAGSQPANPEAATLAAGLY